MRSPRARALVWLLLVAALLAGGNLWFAAARSTIPLKLASERVVRKEVRREKHPGKDDVCLLHFASGRRLHVDAALFHAVQLDAILKKDAWSAEVLHNDVPIRLTWSADFRGMLAAMPLLLAILLVTAVRAASPSRAARVEAPVLEQRVDQDLDD